MTEADAFYNHVEDKPSRFWQYNELSFYIH